MNRVSPESEVEEQYESMDEESDSDPAPYIRR